MDTTELLTDENGLPRGADKKEAFHQEREKLVKPFSFRRPEDIPLDHKAFVRLGGTDNINCNVQILNEGGDNNMHYHPNMDSVFYILKGKIKVYGPGDTVIGDFAPNEGCVMPSGARYWFEASGDEEAWLLHVTSYPKGRKYAKRITLEEDTRDDVKSVHYDGDTHAELSRRDRSKEKDPVG